MKLGTGLGIRAVTTWLPTTTESLKDEIDSGRLPPEAAQLLAVTEVPVSAGPAAPEMAVLAGRKVLEQADCDPASIGILAHSWVYHQGHDVWSPAHYVASELNLPPSTLPTGIHELCSGGTSALYVALTSLLADPGMTAALVTTADRFVPPVWDRWRIHPDICYGDGATAALLHRSDGGRDALVLHSLTFATECWLEALTRGDAPFTTAPMEGKENLSSARARAEFYATHGKEPMRAAATERVRTSLHTALDEAGLEPDDPRIRLVVAPRLGPRLLSVMYRDALDSTLHAKTVHLRGRTGHLGAGDMLANLADVVEQRMLEPGEFAVVLGCGSGFTWSTAVVQAV